MAVPMSDCGVVLLAGGQSSRMGRPKAWLEFGGRPILAHLVERMLTVFPDVIVVAAPDQQLPDTPARIVHDEQPGEGPMAGLVVSLRVVYRPLAFVCSCDAPFLNPRLAAHLIALTEGYDVVVPEWRGRLHPLHAVYRTSVQPLLAQQFANGDRRLMDLFDRVATRIVPEDELRALDPDGDSFFNMNSPRDYAKARTLWSILTP